MKSAEPWNAEPGVQKAETLKAETISFPRGKGAKRKSQRNGKAGVQRVSILWRRGLGTARGPRKKLMVES
jgi:hypothetical protein